MTDFSGDLVCSLCSYIASLQSDWSRRKSELLTAEIKADVLDSLKQIVAACKKFGVTTVSTYIQDALPAVESAPADWNFKDLHNLFGNLHLMIRAEMKQVKFFMVAKNNAQYFGEPKLFGDKVFNNFRSADEDIAEAGNCLALGRSTACVMHLARTVEVGLQSLASNLGIGKQNDWGSYLRKTEEELLKRLKVSGARSSAEQFYSEARITFDAMRRAWRNPTMHVDKTYSQDRAEEIFISVRSFMKHLAEGGLSE